MNTSAQDCHLDWKATSAALEVLCYAKPCWCYSAKGLRHAHCTWTMKLCLNSCMSVFVSFAGEICKWGSCVCIWDNCLILPEQVFVPAAIGQHHQEILQSQGLALGAGLCPGWIMVLTLWTSSSLWAPCSHSGWRTCMCWSEAVVAEVTAVGNGKTGLHLWSVLSPHSPGDYNQIESTVVLFCIIPPSLPTVDSSSGHNN